LKADVPLETPRTILHGTEDVLDRVESATYIAADFGGPEPVTPVAEQWGII
jgi:hypothetical protein